MSRVVVLLVALASCPAAWARPVAATATSDTRSCLPLADGRVVVGTAGGLIIADTADAPGPVATALSGLPGTRVYSLAPGPSVAGDRTVWVGTDGGLAQVRVTGRSSIVLNAVNSRPVRAILPGGMPVIGTWGDGVQRVRRGALESLDGPARVAALARHRGAIYAGGPSGLHVQRDGEWRAVPALSGRMVHTLRSTATGLLVGTLTGLVRYRVESAESPLEVLSQDDVRGIAADGMLATFGQGVVGGPADVRYAYGATSLGVDPDGLACVAARGGVRIRRAGRWRALALPGPPDNDVSALVVQGQRLWVGTFDRGLGTMQDGVWETVAGVDPRVNSLAVQAGGVWVGTARGLFRVVRVGARWHVDRYGTADGLPSADIRSLSAIPDSDAVLVGTARAAAIVAATDAGVATVHPLGRKQRLAVRSVWASAVDADGGIWIGTARGLLYRKKGRKWFRRFSVASGHLRDDWVTAILVRGGKGQPKTAWVGTYNGGVHRIHKRRSTALGGGWVNPGGLTFVGNRLLASTMDGLVALDTSDLATTDRSRPQWRAVAGVDRRDVTGTASLGDTLWIASRRGLIRTR